jgi:hypothetical protein
MVFLDRNLFYCARESIVLSIWWWKVFSQLKLYQSIHHSTLIFSYLTIKAIYDSTFIFHGKLPMFLTCTITSQCYYNYIIRKS